MSEEKNIRFGKNVRFIRKAYGINDRGSPYSQTEFAEKLNVTKRSIILWESGNIPSRKNLNKLAELFSSMVGFQVEPNILLEKDITNKVELIPRSDFEKDLSPEHRKILRSLFLSAGNLDQNQLLKVINFIDNLKED